MAWILQRFCMEFDVIIIGAGAAGLAAISELTAAGMKVCLLEAADVAGGRIMTLRQEGFDGPAESGAEFIHGNPPLTLGLLREANIAYRQVTGDMIPVRNGVWFDENGNDNDWEKFMEAAEQLEADSTINDFLNQHFPAGEYDMLRQSVLGFSQGFELADTSRASVKTLLEEMKSSKEPQYRIEGGYGQLINYLSDKCRVPGSVMHVSSPVSRVEHTTGKVTVYTTRNEKYQAGKLIVTASAAVMQSGLIGFAPALAGHQAAWQQIGFGSVVKILFRFKEAFWKMHRADMGFILSDQYIPVWWTQLPDEQSCLLTGWLGGPQAVIANQLPGDELYEHALSSLAGIFNTGVPVLRSMLIHHKISCWDQVPYIKGGYSYSIPGSEAAVAVLLKPVNDTIYFAGEALYSGPFKSTVESALVSGKNAAKEIIKAQVTIQ